MSAVQLLPGNWIVALMKIQSCSALLSSALCLPQEAEHSFFPLPAPRLLSLSPFSPALSAADGPRRTPEPNPHVQKARVTKPAVSLLCGGVVKCRHAPETARPQEPYPRGGGWAQGRRLRVSRVRPFGRASGPWVLMRRGHALSRTGRRPGPSARWTRRARARG